MMSSPDTMWPPWQQGRYREELVPGPSQTAWVHFTRPVSVVLYRWSKRAWFSCVEGLLSHCRRAGRARTVNQ